MTKTNNRITLRDVYQVVNRMEDKLDKRMYNMECRIDILEAFKGRVMGVAGLVGAVAGSVISITWSKLNGK